MGRSDRRTFLKQVGVLGAAVAAGPGLFLGTKKSFGATADIYVATGDDYYQNTIKVVETLGGMKKFVGPNAKVGLLVNSPFSNPGTFASPDVAVAVVEMCFDAGAKEVGC
jgi:anaerobic selenocysteine-containing dehydrogenase